MIPNTANTTVNPALDGLDTAAQSLPISTSRGLTFGVRDVIDTFEHGAISISMLETRSFTGPANMKIMKLMTATLTATHGTHCRT